MAPGITGLVGGRAKVSPVIRLFSFLHPKAEIDAQLQPGNSQTLDTVSVDTNDYAFTEPGVASPCAPPATTTRSVPLIKLAWARSGDKGNHANIGVIARQSDWLPYIEAALTPDAVGQFMRHCFDAEPVVKTWRLPGIQAINLLLENSLGGGGICSLRSDPQGKAFAQQLLEFSVPVSEAVFQAVTTNEQAQDSFKPDCNHHEDQ
jgi:hypothetical protein